MQFNIINSIRTNNFNDGQVMDKIKKLWEEATSSLKQHNDNIYGVYYEYESNYKGDYSLAVAIEGDGKPNIDISATEKYEVFSVDTTDEQGILKAWSRIWEMEEAGTLNRAYTFDYEKYSPNGKVEIHIAIK